MAEGVRRVRWVLLVLAAVVSVAVAVAANQILTEAGWNWWWSIPAVVLAAASLWATDRLTRKPAAVPEPRPERVPSGQTVAGSTAGGHITQMKDVHGNVRLGAFSTVVPSSATTEPVAPSDTPRPAEGERHEGEEKGGGGGSVPEAGGQQVRGSHVGGSITQITGVDGDVTIERS